MNPFIAMALDAFETLQHFGVVDEGANRCLVTEFHDTFDMSLCQRKSPRDVVKSCSDELLHFVDGGGGNTACTELQLVVGDLDAFVCLDVWTQGDAKGVCAILHAREIALENAMVDEQRGGGQVVD